MNLSDATTIQKGEKIPHEKKKKERKERKKRGMLFENKEKEEKREVVSPVVTSPFPSLSLSSDLQFSPLLETQKKRGGGERRGDRS